MKKRNKVQLYSLLALTGLVGGMVVLNKTITSQQNIATTTRYANVLGSATVADGYEISVLHMTSEKYAKDLTKQRVRLTVYIKNTTANDMLISPGLQMVVRDNRSTTYPYTAEFLPEHYTIGGMLGVGQSRQYDVDFVIPVNVQVKAFLLQKTGDAPVSEVAL